MPLCVLLYGPIIIQICAPGCIGENVYLFIYENNLEISSTYHTFLAKPYAS